MVDVDSMQEFPALQHDSPPPVTPQPGLPSPAALFPAPDAAADLPPPKNKRGKRYRPFRPPFHELLYGMNGKKIRIRLEVPDPEEECPLTLDPIKDDALPFLSQDARWFTAFPEVTKATLACGHGFGALNLLYHFARRNMLCPCCRAGINDRLSLHCYPQHLRLRLNAKVRAELDTDEQEHVREDRVAATAIASSLLAGAEDSNARSPWMAFEVQLIDFRERGSIRLAMRFFGVDANSTVTIDVPLSPRPNPASTNRVFYLQPGPYTSLIEAQLNDPSVRSFQLVSCVHLFQRTIEIASTERVVIDRSQNRTCITVPSVRGGTYYDLDFQRCGDETGLSIYWLGWRTPLAMFSGDDIIMSV